MEEWRKVQGFVGYSGADTLEVSDFGRVRRNGAVEPPIINKRGHWVDFCKSGHREWLPRLILRTFNGECPEGLFAVMIDRDYSNCKLENLTWGTNSDKVPKKRKPRAKITKTSRPEVGREVFDAWMKKKLKL